MDKKKKRLMYFMYYLAWVLGFVAIAVLIYGIIKAVV
jgi:hypothetical protein